MSNIIDGGAIARTIKDDVRRDVTRFHEQHGRAPGLGTLLVGDDAASATYIAMKRRTCDELGIASVHRTLTGRATQLDVEAATHELVSDDAVDGVLVQMPLPDGLDPDPVILAIPPAKDVDGFHPFNVGAIASGLDGTPPCTPAGVLRLLDAYDVALDGAEAVVIGRSRTVGMPMALLLLQRNATVTVTHNRTRDLAAATRRADVLVTATGVPGLVTADMVKSGAVVIDVGTTRTPDGLRGDVDFEPVREVASLITPVPGGVGPMTIAMLMHATVQLAWRRAGAAGGAA